MALDQNDIKQVSDLIAAANKTVSDAVAALSKSVETVTASIDTKIKAVVDPIAASVAKITAAPKGKGKKGEKADDDDDEDDEADDAEAPKWAKDLSAKIDALEKGVQPVIQDREAGAKKTAAQKLLADYESKHKLTGLSNDPTIIKLVIADGITDEAGVASVVEPERQRLKNMGIDVEKKWPSASPAGEGAKASDADKTDREAQIKANVEAASKLRKQTF